MELIRTAFADGVGTITFNNAGKRNCLSNALLKEFDESLEAFDARKARAVVIRAEKGAKVWSSGFDINELPDPGRDPLSYYDPLETVLRKIQKLSCPVIAMVEGSVWGGACDLSFTCDIVVGGPSAAFAMTPAKVGVPYNTSGLLHFINVVGVRIAREMFFTAQLIQAERALQIGILNYLLPTEVIESFTYDLARKICGNSPLGIAVIKEQLRILSNSHPISPETFERIQGLRRTAYDSADYREGKLAFLEKRHPVFTGE